MIGAISLDLPEAYSARQRSRERPPCAIEDHEWATIMIEAHGYEALMISGIGYICRVCGLYPLEVLDRWPVREAALDAVVTR